jgi:hypothetical protein
MKEDFIFVRRQYDDYRIAKYRLSDISDIKWDWISGGAMVRTSRPFLYGKVICDAMVDGELAHYGIHGSCPHFIKVCIVKKDNDPEVYNLLLEKAGPKPEMPPVCCSKMVFFLLKELGPLRGPELKSALERKGYTLRWIGKVLPRLERKGLLCVKRDGRAKVYDLINQGTPTTSNAL